MPKKYYNYTSTYKMYRYKYDYYIYLQCILIREGRPVSDLGKTLGINPKYSSFIHNGARKCSKAELIKLANEFNINIKMWATKSIYVYCLFEADFSPDEREEILRQRIWEPDTE